nr:sulfatase-like hydrolase/transferase [Paenibacillus sp. F411]
MFIYTDQQRWDALGANGNPEIHTPNLDRLAAEGVNLDHYFVQNPICMPSRISFLSGRYPSSLGITHMAVPVPEDTVILPKLLRNYGYVTGNIGKLHFLPHSNRDHREIHPDYGFDHLEISDEPGCYEDAYRAWVRMKAPEELEHISLGIPPAAEDWNRIMAVEDHITHPEREPKRAAAFPGREDVTHAAFVAEQTEQFIESHQHESWMCIAGFYSPHTPWVAPQRFLDLYDPDQLSVPNYPPHLESQRSDSYFSDRELRSVKQGYYAMVSEVDEYVGKLLDRLDALGLSENTIVVFTSDHGEYLGEHLRYQKGYPGEDCISRVPCIIRWPAGIQKPGRVFSGITEAVDILPTVLECCGIPVPASLQGKSLRPLLYNECFAGKEEALMEFKGWKNIRTKDYRYVCEENGRESLYYLPNDPMQYDNLADHPAHQDALYDMRKRMLLKVLQVEQPLQRTWVY